MFLLGRLLVVHLHKRSILAEQDMEETVTHTHGHTHEPHSSRFSVMPSCQGEVGVRGTFLCVKIARHTLSSGPAFNPSLLRSSLSINSSMSVSVSSSPKIRSIDSLLSPSSLSHSTSLGSDSLSTTASCLCMGSLVRLLAARL